MYHCFSHLGELNYPCGLWRSGQPSGPPVGQEPADEHTRFWWSWKSANSSALTQQHLSYQWVCSLELPLCFMYYDNFSLQALKKEKLTVGHLELSGSCATELAFNIKCCHCPVEGIIVPVWWLQMAFCPHFPCKINLDVSFLNKWPRIE